jgi:hypothetical protein
LPGDPLSGLSAFHPLIVEGPAGRRDSRDPEAVADRLATALRIRWQEDPIVGTPLLVTQGDPLESTGISAITHRLAASLQIPRALVCLDEHIAPYHARDADRSGMVMEFRYSQLTTVLDAVEPGATERLASAVAAGVSARNDRRTARGQPPLKRYFRDFALLQEVTKAAVRQHCGAVTVAHTISPVHEFSVTSFYTIGLSLGWIDPADMLTAY